MIIGRDVLDLATNRLHDQDIHNAEREHYAVQTLNDNHQNLAITLP